VSRLAKIAALAVFVVVAAGFFYLRVLARRIFVETPVRVEQEARARLSEVVLQSRTGSRRAVLLYFPSYGAGTLAAAEVRQMAWPAEDSDRIREILLALIEGSRQGHERPVSPSTNIRGVFLTADGTAYVDFSSEVLADFAPGIESESLAVYSIVDSLAANIPAVKKVKILVEGEEVDTLDGHADLTGYFVPDLSRTGKAN
jgi:spore germination protein GerM